MNSEMLSSAVRFNRPLMPPSCATSPVSWPMPTMLVTPGPSAWPAMAWPMPAGIAATTFHVLFSERPSASSASSMSWLASLPVPVLNLPVIEGLCGAWRHQSEWVWLAGQAGLDAGDYVQQVASDAPPSRKAEPAVPHLRTVIAIDGRGIGEQVTDDVADACGRLGALAGTRILGVHLHPQSGTFISASPLPDLRAGGERVIDALASALRGAA